MKRSLILLLVVAPLLWACATTDTSPTHRLLAAYPPERPFPDSRFSTFDNVMIHYRTWTPDGEPIGKLLLLHEAGGSSVTYRLLAPELARAGYAVVAADLPGFGFSGQALDLDHTLGNRAELLWSLADRLDTEDDAFPPVDRWILVGHGMGGRVATQMAIERPARSRGLVLLSADVTGAADPGAWYWFPPVRWSVLSWLRNSVFTPDGVAELLESAYGRPATADEVGLYAAPLLRPSMPEAYVRYASTAGRADFTLDSIETPTLIVWGEADEWTDPELGAQAAAEIPSSVLITIPGAGHLPMETDVEQTRDVLLSWLARR
ncbi:MAG: alpha/beta fold hydrolase [Spirochaetota bacterium]